VEDTDVFGLAKKMDIKDQKLVVYTCLTGNYEKPAQNHVTDDNVKYVYFSDKKTSVADGWELKIIEGLEHLDDKDKNRYIKMNPHKFLKEFDMSIYIDCNIKIINKLTNIFSKAKQDSESIFMYEHPFTNCTYKELEIIVNKGLASFSEAKKQYMRYKSLSFPINFGLFEANIIIRKHDNDTQRLMEAWWSEYNNSTKRDQTSLMFASFQTGISICNLGKCNLREGGDYFYLDLSKRKRNLKPKIKNKVVKILNYIFSIFGASLK
jgi:hypothetical protein